MQSKKRKLNGSRSTSGSNPRTSSLSSFPPMSQVQCDINPDFTHLASVYPEFQKKWTELRERLKTKDHRATFKPTFSAHVDFEFNLALTRSLLQEHFQLSLPSMPRGYLCPPVPNRFNYVLWLKELLCESSGCLKGGEDGDEQNAPYFYQKEDDCAQGQHLEQRRVRRGLDLGTGASCIYPLLLSRNEFTNGEPWQFLATDIDPYSIQSAQKNVEANGLKDQVKLTIVSPSEPSMMSTEIPRSNEKKLSIPRTDGEKELNLTTPLKTAMEAARTAFSNDTSNERKGDDYVKFEFCMTNPPFYSTAKEASAPRSGDGRDRIEMTFNESIYPGNPGGEIGFALDIISDSLIIRDNITWYTIMLSKKSSLAYLVKELNQLGFDRGSIRTVEFVQGNMMRWGIAWTFLLPMARSPATRLIGGLNSFQVMLETKTNRAMALKEVADRVKCFCDELKVIKLKYSQNGENCLSITEERNKKSDQQTLSSVKTGMTIGQHKFIIDIRLYCMTMDTNISGVMIYLQCFSISEEGVLAVRKIQQQMKGDICRTNRRWRRLMKRSG